jgi:hypothetical protein
MTVEFLLSTSCTHKEAMRELQEKLAFDNPPLNILDAGIFEGPQDLLTRIERTRATKKLSITVS